MNCGLNYIFKGKMKRVIFYIVLSSVLFLLLNLFISNAKLYIDKTGKVDKNFLKISNQYKGVDADKGVLLVIGNSYVNTSFDDDVTELATGVKPIKFVVSGMPFEDAVLIAKFYAKNAKTKQLLIGIGYNEASPLDSNSSVYKTHTSDFAIARIWYSIPIVRARSMTIDIIRKEIRVMIDNSISENEEVLNSQKKIEKDIDLQVEHKKWIAKSTEQRYSEYVTFTNSVSPKFYRLLSDLESVAEDNSLRLMVYTAPIYTKLRNRLNQETLDKFNTELSNRDFQYVNLNDVFSDLDGSYFSDATHLIIPKGRDLSTAYLKNWILDQ